MHPPKKKNILNKQPGFQRFLPTNDCIPKNILLSRVSCEKEGIVSYGNPTDIVGIGGGGALVLIFFLIYIFCKCLGKIRPLPTDS